MKNIIGIRKEDKSKWERRIPFTPEAIAELRAKGFDIFVESSPVRIYSDAEFEALGIPVLEDLIGGKVIFAVKEIPVALIEDDKVYIFFSHTIKGQDYNMALLQRLLDSGSTLIDYEKIANEKGQRLVFFGAHAGYAGMIDALALLGERHLAEGKKCAFGKIKMAHAYPSLDDARKAVSELGDHIRDKGFKRDKPFVIGFTGYGNVSKGAQSIASHLPIETVCPEDLPALFDGEFDAHKVYSVEFHESDMARRKDGGDFVLQEYYDKPELFESAFGQYLPFLTIMVNCIYWTPDYPRLVRKAQLREGWKNGDLHGLEIIADISIDVEGSIEASYKATSSDSPAYVYIAEEDRFVDGPAGNGPTILAVDNLPCEISKESSETFSEALTPFVPEIAECNFAENLDALALPDALKRAIITHKGALTPDYEYLQKFLDEYKKD